MMCPGSDLEAALYESSASGLSTASPGPSLVPRFLQEPGNEYTTSPSSAVLQR